MSYDNLINGKFILFELVVILGLLWLSVFSLNLENLGWVFRYLWGSLGFDIFMDRYIVSR